MRRMMMAAPSGGRALLAWRRATLATISNCTRVAATIHRAPAPHARLRLPLAIPIALPRALT